MENSNGQEEDVAFTIDVDASLNSGNLTPGGMDIFKALTYDFTIS